MSIFHRIFGPATPPADAHDAELGPLTWSADLEGWVAASPAPRATFLIAGGRAPDPALLSHARDIARAFPQFQAVVQVFLHQEAARFPPALAVEIRALELESINLFWPERPDDGMLYFQGQNEDRVWRSDYVGRKPKDLGFDS